MQNKQVLNEIQVKEVKKRKYHVIVLFEKIKNYFILFRYVYVYEKPLRCVKASVDFFFV